MKGKESKIIGTISLNINTPDFNYGALLHSYAFQKYLQNNSLCEYTEIVNYVTPSLENYNIKNPIIYSIKNRKAKSFIKNVLIYPFYRKRYIKFKKFIKDNMNISNNKYTQKELEKDVLKYDTIICESDVIWSPGFFGGKFDKTFFMDLKSMENMKKIAYAPSMADAKLNKEQEEDIKKLLSKIDYISCRETYGVEVLNKLIKRKVEHVLDPVMLLSEKDYENIIAKRIVKEKYLLLYLPVDNNKKLRKAAIEYAKVKKLRIVEISTKCLPKIKNKVLVSAGIEEFLSAIKYADIIFTNSFHAICFALIFNIDFYAFSRGSYGKVKDICEITGLSDRFFKDDNFKELKGIDYSIVNSRIEKLKLKSKEWLYNALKE